MASATYQGALPRGIVRIGERDAAFTRGEPIEVAADEAALLPDDEWTVTKPKRKRAEDPTVTPEADEADPTAIKEATP